MATSYWDYIRVEDLLALQTGIDGDERQLGNDEVRFIVIHQIDELWFKLAIRELLAARDLFARDHVPETALSGASLALKRLTAIFRLAAQHFELMETMRTQDYLTFRDKLNPASGFQSAQMREVEILFGLDDDQRIPFGNEGSYMVALRDPRGGSSPALERVERRLQDTPTLKQALDHWLFRTPNDGSTPGRPGDAAAVDAFLASYLRGHEQLHQRNLAEAIRVQAFTETDKQRLEARYHGQLQGARRHLLAEDVDGEHRAFRKRVRAAILFIDSFRSLPLLSWPGQIIDGLIEAEQSMLVFRQRHARMVERVIGRRIGTGGSDGVDYLDQTALRYRVFTEMWAARTLLLPPDLLPDVANRDFYGLLHQ